MEAGLAEVFEAEGDWRNACSAGGKQAGPARQCAGPATVGYFFGALLSPAAAPLLSEPEELLFVLVWWWVV